MAVVAFTSQAELERSGELAYKTNRIRIFLANDPASSLTVNSSRTAWEALKLTNGVNGYNDFTFVVPDGTWNSTTGRFELGGASGATVNAVFTAAGGTLTHDRIVGVVGIPAGGGSFTEPSNIAFLLVEPAPVTILDTLSCTYKINLISRGGA